MASAEAQRMHAEHRARHRAFIDQHGSTDLGPEIAAISRRAIQQYSQVTRAALAQDNALRVKNGTLAPADWPDAYFPYDPHYDYARHHDSHHYMHCGLRAALLAALAVRFPEPAFNALERDWLADHLSRRSELNHTEEP